MNRKTANAFTLIELLVTISVVAILAGLTYRIIDVRGVRNRARDSNITTGIDKMVASIEGYVSARGRSPDAEKLTDLLENVQTHSACTGRVHCLFTLTGFDLPQTCGSNHFAGSADQICYFYYVPLTIGSDLTQYAIIGKSWGDTGVTLGYISNRGKVECPANMGSDIDDPDLTGCTVIVTD